MQKVTNVESSKNSLAEARERVNKLMEKRNGEEFNFDERLQRAKEEIWEKEQEAYEDNAKRQQTILSYVELYTLKRGIDNINNHLHSSL